MCLETGASILFSNLATNEMVTTRNAFEHEKVKGKRVIRHTGFILKVILRLHKPEGSKNSRCCDVLLRWTAHPTLRAF